MTMTEPTAETIRAYTTCRVIAGPLGYYGLVDGVVITTLQPTPAAAKQAMYDAVAFLRGAGHHFSAAAPHAWRMATAPHKEE